MWENSPVGPFDLWPTGSGFEYFYGFIGGGTNQWYPGLYEGTSPVEPTQTPEEGYHLTEDLADRTIAWIRQQKTLAPDKPFFAYFAPGATHAPHHAPKEWIDRYRGRFDAGGTRFGRRPSHDRRRSGSSQPIPSSPTVRRRSRHGTTSTMTSSRCWPARWRSTPASSPTPTTTSVA